MKKNKLIYKLFFALSLSVIMMSCSDDDENGSGVSFNGIASSLFEDNATTTVTVPFRDGSLSEDEVVISGTATEGQDYTFDGITEDGLQFTILEDDKWEVNETIIVRIPSSSGNSIHTITLVSNCEDAVSVPLASFAGVWHATEFYCGLGVTTGNCDFGPYNVTFTQNSTDPTRFSFPNFYGSGATFTAYLIFDTATGTVRFPDQTIGAPANDRGPLTASTGTFDLCDDTLTINLTYDGGPWVYHFTRN